jgi:hypothetical protein
MSYSTVVSLRPAGFAALIVSVMLAGATLESARAESGLHFVYWCQGDPYKPWDPAAREVETPGGKRGTLTANQLVRKARWAAREGRDDDAIAYIKACQWHNQESYKDIDRDRAAILEYLRNLEMM